MTVTLHRLSPCFSTGIDHTTHPGGGGSVRDEQSIEGGAIRATERRNQCLSHFTSVGIGPCNASVKPRRSSRLRAARPTFSQTGYFASFGARGAHRERKKETGGVRDREVNRERASGRTERHLVWDAPVRPRCAPSPTATPTDTLARTATVKDRPIPAHAVPALPERGARTADHSNDRRLRFGNCDLLREWRDEERLITRGLVMQNIDHEHTNRVG